ncbi:MAG: hypothetical protein IKL24_06830 [Clostridia bacterium]|nr:hypothetical protein [Clostridia bacterium]
MFEFNCPGHKPWQISEGGRITIGDDDLVTPHILRTVYVFFPEESSGENGYISLTDCYNRKKTVWFSCDELADARAAVDILRPFAQTVNELSAADLPDDSDNELSEPVKEPAVRAASEHKGEGYDKKASSSVYESPTQINFKKSVPEAAALRSTGQDVEKVGNVVYAVEVAIAVLSLVVAIVAGMVLAVEMEDVLLFFMSLVTGLVAYILMMVSAWLTRLAFRCVSSFLVGQSCIVQSATVTARTNLYIADMLEKQNEEK